MSRIIYADPKTENDRLLKYKLTTSPEIQKMSDLEGQRIDIIHFCEYEDVKVDREGVEKATIVLSVMTREGEMFATNSSTVRDDFRNIFDIFGDDLNYDNGTIPVRIKSGQSKNGRKYFFMVYAD